MLSVTKAEDEQGKRRKKRAAAVPTSEIYCPHAYLILCYRETLNDSEKVRTGAQNSLFPVYREKCHVSPIVAQIPEALSEKSNAGRAGHHYTAGHQEPRALPSRDVRQPAVYKFLPLADRGSISEGTDHLLPTLRGDMGGPGEGASGHHEEGAESAGARTQVSICQRNAHLTLRPG